MGWAYCQKKEKELISLAITKPHEPHQYAWHGPLATQQHPNTPWLGTSLWQPQGVAQCQIGSQRRHY